jgi:hypothetical protein
VTGYISVTQTIAGPTRTLPGPTRTQTIPGPTRTQTIPGPTIDRTLTRDITRTIATTEVLTFNRTIIQTSVTISTRLSTITLPVRTFPNVLQDKLDIVGINLCYVLIDAETLLTSCRRLRGSPLRLSKDHREQSRHSFRLKPLLRQSLQRQSYLL